MADESVDDWSIGSVTVVFSLVLAVPVLWIAGAIMVSNSRLQCAANPAVAVCQPGAGALVMVLPGIAAVLGLVITLAARRRPIVLALACLLPIVALALSRGVSAGA